MPQSRENWMLWVLNVHINAEKRFSWGAMTLMWPTHTCLCWNRTDSGACKIWVRLILMRKRPWASQLHQGRHQQVWWILTLTWLPFVIFICGQCSFSSFNGYEHAHYTFLPLLRVHSVYTCQLCWGRHLYGTWVSAWRHLVEGPHMLLCCSVSSGSLSHSFSLRLFFSSRFVFSEVTIRF